MKKLTNLVVVTVMVAAGVASATAARVAPVDRPVVPRYQLTVLSPLDADTYADGINDSGAIVATGYDQQWSGHGYVFQGRRVRDLGPGTSARGISNSGAVCGWSAGACWWPKNGEPVYISPDMPLADTYAISSWGEVVGEVAVPPSFDSFPFVYSGKLTVLSTQPGAAMAISGQGLIGGCVVGPYWYIPCLWASSRRGYARIDLPLSDGDIGGGVRSVNNLGEAAGWAESYWETRATVWHLRGAGYVAESLAQTDGYSVAMSLNNRGQVVGCAYNGSITTACLWDAGRVYDLNEVVADGKDCSLQIAVGINDSRQIACRARCLSTGKMVAVLLTPIH